MKIKIDNFTITETGLAYKGNPDYTTAYELAAKLGRRTDVTTRWHIADAIVMHIDSMDPTMRSTVVNVLSDIFSMSDTAINSYYNTAKCIPPEYRDLSIPFTTQCSVVAGQYGAGLSPEDLVAAAKHMDASYNNSTSAMSDLIVLDYGAVVPKKMAVLLDAPDYDGADDVVLVRTHWRRKNADKTAICKSGTSARKTDLKGACVNVGCQFLRDLIDDLKLISRKNVKEEDKEFILDYVKRIYSEVSLPLVRHMLSGAAQAREN